MVPPIITIKNVTGPKCSQIDGPHPPLDETLLTMPDGNNGGVNDHYWRLFYKSYILR
jgi:hypothetical protein